jgi:uncharacterized membrane protein
MSAIDQEKSSTGLEVRLAAALAYLGVFVTGILLLVVEKDSPYVRFHAMQSTIVFLIVAGVQLVLWGIPLLGWLLSILVVFPLQIFLWLFLMYKAYQGERYKLPVVGDLAERQVAA